MSYEDCVKVICEGRSNFEGSKDRIRKIIESDMSKGEKVKALRDEFGVGGGSKKYDLYESHDKKGIKFTKGSFFDGDVWRFSWGEVVEILEKEFSGDKSEQMSFDFG